VIGDLWVMGYDLVCKGTTKIAHMQIFAIKNSKFKIKNVFLRVISVILFA
jgi:hypothetical protein